MKPKIVCVVPTCRGEQLGKFEEAWKPLFEKHGVQWVVVVDGDQPILFTPNGNQIAARVGLPRDLFDCFCRRTDAVRNYGFAWAARHLDFDYLLTLDDDVAPIVGFTDTIDNHLAVMGRKVPQSWMNTAQPFDAQDQTPYLRGFPYGVREEAMVHLSHGVWVGVPDFDAKTQLAYGNDIPTHLNYFKGPVPRGVYMPLCGMNLMVTREALPHLYFAPQGPDSGDPAVNRFGDIWMGITLLRAFWSERKAVWTGTAVVEHTRASDAQKNLQLEAKGLKWNEDFWWNDQTSAFDDPEARAYWTSYQDKARRYRDFMTGLLAR